MAVSWQKPTPPWGPGGHLGDMVEGEIIVTLSLEWAGCVRRTGEDEADRAEGQTTHGRDRAGAADG